MDGTMKNGVIVCFRLIIKCYKLGISPFISPRCRFLPTCSDYAEEALKIHGPYKGLCLIVCRISRCNVLSEQRVDPVPIKKNEI